MGCYRPLAATQLLGGKILIWDKVTNLTRKPTPPSHGRDIQLPCNQCIGCRCDRATQWATRCLHESQMHLANCALTLTYSDDPNYEAIASNQDRDYPHQDMWIARKSAREFSTDGERAKATQPKNPSVDNSRSNIRKERRVDLSRNDHQKFVKRLRKKIGQVRYYMCGEYGTKLSRPHYHYLLFGYDFPDKKYFKKSEAGTKLYRSETLETLWPHGYSWIGEVDYHTCAYVAGYIMKKITGPMAEDYYRRTDEAGNDFWLTPEFNHMSRDPGIAKTWWDKYHQDVLVDDCVYRGSSPMKPPRYYDKLLLELDALKYQALKDARLDRAALKADDNTPARLEAKETVQRARLNTKKRQLETI